MLTVTYCESLTLSHVINFGTLITLLLFTSFQLLAIISYNKIRLLVGRIDWSISLLTKNVNSLIFILIGYSQLLALLGIMSVLLLLLGSSMASSTQTSTSQADGRSSLPSVSLITNFTYSNVLKLQKLIYKIQAEFVSRK